MGLETKDSGRRMEKTLCGVFLYFVPVPDKPGLLQYGWFTEMRVVVVRIRIPQGPRFGDGESGRTFC